MRRVVLVTLLAVSFARASDDAGTMEQRVRAHDADRTRRIYGLARVHWDYPTELTGGSGILVTRLPKDYDCATTCPMRGFTVQGALGTGGAEASIGYASLVAETGRSRAFLRHVYVGYGIRAAYVRTWGSSNLSPEGDDFVGVQSGWTIAQFSVTFGVFRRVPASDPGDRTKVFAGIGWGF
ncbi:MAG TPA: hypothetical protein VMT33_03105 [Candidatus Bathyarchaeia archaeon]|nr:hypothetical protein [Candidatus Bathyarchaeia archaeon]